MKKRKINTNILAIVVTSISILLFAALFSIAPYWNEKKNSEENILATLSPSFSPSPSPTPTPPNYVGPPIPTTDPVTGLPLVTCGTSTSSSAPSGSCFLGWIIGTSPLTPYFGSCYQVGSGNIGSTTYYDYACLADNYSPPPLKVPEDYLVVPVTPTPIPTPTYTPVPTYTPTPTPIQNYP